MSRSLSAVILAAGKGTRMRSDLPKVAHEVAGAPMVLWVAKACAGAGCSRIVVVVGYEQETVRAIFEDAWSEDLPPVEFCVQEEQLGTGHAVRYAHALLASEASGAGHAVFVLAGDGPLIRPETLNTLHGLFRETGAAAALATSRIADPSGYGRIVRDDDGVFTGIVEQNDATPEQRAIDEVNPSYYCFDAQKLFASLASLAPSGASGEYYITDVPALLLASGERVEVVDAVPPEDVLSINTPEQLGDVDAVLRARLREGAGA
ncbi:MAG: NTP transferase domain-containing protein [Planctomycetota bacterium]